MNHTLPPTRDVPPRRQAQIRARLEQEVGRGRRATRFAPLIAAGVAAAAVIALVAVAAPWQRGGADTAASRSGYPTTAPPRTYSTAERPVIANLSPERVAEVERGCVESAGIDGKAVLHQYVTDTIGTFALLYTEDAMLSCTVDGPTMPYNSGFTAMLEIEWLPGEFAADEIGSASGGDGGKPEYAGKPGYDMVAGRVSSKVARVTFTQGGQTAEATIANGTFVARIPRPSDWEVPADRGAGDVRAYDAQGGLLGTLEAFSRERCYMNPEYVIVVGNKEADPTTCLPAVSWRH
ncbi:hypothetical protein B0I31_101718 [Saccharothrix carnea]|uniref:Uncharacterized protein n=1 Tax=Saccharothrix carnea TaxID=1280637 RepID=A0A2P8IJA8_SACCR|nr:hypothetical protein [Saccharothrix carnea]PSL58499.1 hypothetical protein B0I31_101718 [Saccharothrix carnea]